MTARHGAGLPGPGAPPPPVDFAALYDAHPEYVARRSAGSLEQSLIDVEVRHFKLPYLLQVLAAAHGPHPARSVLEIGCATGELIAALPVAAGGRRCGVDISAANVAVARARFAQVEFCCGDFRALIDTRFDVVVLSDVLEHVPDDVGFLHAAARLGGTVLLNLPLEDNWLNRGRRYGVADVSGHLRKYSLGDALALAEGAGLEVLAHTRVWFHETPAEAARRAVRHERLGQAYAGSWTGRQLRRGVLALARAVPSVGRRMFASNLFLAARRRADAAPAAPAAAVRGEHSP